MRRLRKQTLKTDSLRPETDCPGSWIPSTVRGNAIQTRDVSLVSPARFSFILDGADRDTVPGFFFEHIADALSFSLNTVGFDAILLDERILD